MKRRIGSLLGVCLLAGGCVVATAVPSNRDPLPPGSAPTPTESALESDIHQLVNRHRAARRLPPLEWDPRIAAAAREHSRAMAEGRRAFGHDGFEERAEAVRRFMAIRSLAENVAYDSRTGPELATHVVDGWIASTGHRQNIEGGSTHTGIGVARNAEGVRYFTQIFVGAN